MNYILPKIENSELLVALIEFFTSLIEKCHVQNEGNIINTIKNSKLVELMNNFKDDFTEEIYRGMFQKLIVTFHTSNKILEICLFYVENRIRQKPSFENMNLLLYILSKSDNNEDNKKLVIEFIKRNYNIFTTKFNYNISTVISDILTQILLYQVLSEEEIIKIVNLVISNYISTKDKFISFYQFMLNSEKFINEGNKINDENDILKKIDDFSDYKTSLLEVLKIALIIFSNEQKDIADKFGEILLLIFEEINMVINLKRKNNVLSGTKYKNFNYNFINILLDIMARLCLYNPKNFQIVLNKFITTNKLNSEQYIIDIMNIMIETLNFIQRGINVLFISTMITWFGFNFLNNNSNLIFDLVVSRITEKKAPINDDSFLGKNKYVDSLRKQKIENNETLLQIYDLKTNFVQAVNMTCQNMAVDTMYWINSLQINDIRKKKLKDIFRI
jgi:hypothetical protein